MTDESNQKKHDNLALIVQTKTRLIAALHSQNQLLPIIRSDLLDEFSDLSLRKPVILSQ